MNYTSKFNTEALITAPFLGIVGGGIIFLILSSFDIGQIAPALIGIFTTAALMSLVLWDIKKLSIQGDEITFEKVFGTSKFKLDEVEEILDRNHWGKYSSRTLIIILKNGKKIKVRENRDWAFQGLKRDLESLGNPFEIRKV